VERKPRSRDGRKENLEIFDFFIIEPHPSEHGPGLAKRVRPHAVFRVGLPRAAKLVTVTVLVNTFAVLFVPQPVAYDNAVRLLYSRGYGRSLKL